MGDVVDAAIREPARAQRIARLAEQLAIQAGMPAGDAAAVGIAALLLDIGHLGVPRHILQKPAILSIDEMEIMRRHPGWAARLLEQLPGFEDIAGWVEAHHERPDGRGYPEMLDGDEIPVPSRLLAIADAYWALRAARPYREALSHREALGLIDDEAGNQFDTDIAALLPQAVEAMEEAA